jgi:hypothetical protein
MSVVVLVVVWTSEVLPSTIITSIFDVVFVDAVVVVDVLVIDGVLEVVPFSSGVIFSVEVKVVVSAILLVVDCVVNKVTNNK